MRSHWREFNYMLSEVRKAIEPAFSLRHTVKNWNRIACGLAEPSRRRIIQGKKYGYIYKQVSAYEASPSGWVVSGFHPWTHRRLINIDYDSYYGDQPVYYINDPYPIYWYHNNLWQQNNWHLPPPGPVRSFHGGGHPNASPRTRR